MRMEFEVHLLMNDLDAIITRTTSEFPSGPLGLISPEVIKWRRGVRVKDTRSSLYHPPLRSDHDPGIYTRSSIAWAATAQGHGIPEFGTEGSQQIDSRCFMLGAYLHSDLP